MKKFSFFIITFFVLIFGCRVQSASENNFTSDLVVPVGNIVERLVFQSEYSELDTFTLKLEFVDEEPQHEAFNQEISGSLEDLMTSGEKFFISGIPFGTSLQIKLSVFVSSETAQSKLIYQGVSEKITITKEFTNIKVFMSAVKDTEPEKEPGGEEAGSGSDSGTGGESGSGTETGTTEEISGPLYVPVWARSSSDSTNGYFGVYDAFDEKLSDISLYSVPDGEMPDDFVSDGKGTSYFGYVAINENNVVHGFEIYRYKDGDYSKSNYIWYVTTNTNDVSVLYYDMAYDGDQNALYVMLSCSDRTTYIYKIENPDTKTAPSPDNPTKLIYDSAQTATVTGVTATQFAVYDDTVYLIYWDEAERSTMVCSYDFGGITGVTPFPLAAENVADGYVQYGNMDYLSFPDLAVNEKGIFILAREVSHNVSKSADFINYSRGALIRMTHSLTNPTMTGWTSDETRVFNEDNTSLTSFAAAFWPGDGGSGFWGPERILALKGNALVFADDGAYLYTVDKSASYATTVQKNSIVIVNLSDMTITSTLFANSSTVQFDSTISTP